MADKEKEQQYVVTANFLGASLTRGDIRTADALPSDPEDLLRDGSIRKAKASDTKDGATWVDEPDAGFEERVAAYAAAHPQKEAAPENAPATTPAPAKGATKSTEG